jgi:hypothetical protein
MRTLFFIHEAISTWAARETPTRTAAWTLASQKPQKFTSALGMSQEHFETAYQDQNRSSEVNLSPI